MHGRPNHRAAVVYVGCETVPKYGFLLAYFICFEIGIKGDRYTPEKRDMWELRGPHTPTSDLEQPAYISTLGH